MTIPEIVSYETFTQQVHDCLSHLYDFTYLQDHPLVQRCTPNANGATRVQAFREIVSEVVELLRPGPDVAFQARQAQLYNILVLRYIDQQRTQDVIQHLALSERQFWREHPKAIQTVSQLLWQRLTGTESDNRSEATIYADISAQSELQRVFSHTERTQTELEGLLTGAIAATASLAVQYHVVVHLQPLEAQPPLEVYRSALRQTVILILSQIIAETPRVITVSAKIAKRSCQIIFSTTQEMLSVHAALEKQTTLSYMINTLEGNLRYLSPETSQGKDAKSQLILELPLGQQTILVVDDNPGMIDLFRRYLAGKSYQLLAAQDGEHAIDLARTTVPSVIVLDVMLPGQDGWEILQGLKTHPATRSIPVLICSVLDAQDLALSLGAEAFLPKPPGQAEFLNLVAQWRN